jgi:hypothetical protein
MTGLAIFGITAGLHIIRRRALKSVRQPVASLLKGEPK